MKLPRQTNYELAFAKALEKAKKVPEGNFPCLGAEVCSDGTLKLPVLDTHFLVSLTDGTVTLTDGRPTHIAWGILTMHYLASPADDVELEPSVNFARMSDAIGYAGPYDGRVIQRFLHTVGRTGEGFRDAARKLSGVPVRAGDAAYRFHVFPTFPVTVIWHVGDEERFDELTALSNDEGLPPGATMLYTADAHKRFSVEDVVVLSELLVGKLSGKEW